jgi:hypothetical protein
MVRRLKAGKKLCEDVSDIESVDESYDHFFALPPKL